MRIRRKRNSSDLSDSASSSLGRSRPWTDNSAAPPQSAPKPPQLQAEGQEPTNLLSRLSLERSPAVQPPPETPPQPPVRQILRKLAPQSEPSAPPSQLPFWLQRQREHRNLSQTPEQHNPNPIPTKLHRRIDVAALHRTIAPPLGTSSPIQRKGKTPPPPPTKSLPSLPQQNPQQNQNQTPSVPPLETAQNLTAQDISAQSPFGQERDFTRPRSSLSESGDNPPEPNNLTSETSLENVNRTIQELEQSRISLEQSQSGQRSALASQLLPINGWIANEAATPKKLGLYKFYTSLSPEQQIEALGSMGVNIQSLALEDVKNKLTSRKLLKGFRKKIDWKKFAQAIRDASHSDPWAETFVRDMAEIGGATASALAAAAYQISNLTDASAVADWSAEISAGLGVIGLMITAYRELEECRGRRDLDLWHTRKAKLAATLVDIGRYTATGLVTLGTAAKNGTGILGTLGSGISVAASTAATGALAVVGGAFNLGVGVRQFRRAGQNQEKLKELENRQDLDKNLTGAAKLGGQVQGWERSIAGARAAKGAAMIIGGTLLLLGAGPAGWIALAVGGVIAGAFALRRYFKWRKRKTDFVDEELGVNEQYEQLQKENQKPPKDNIRKYMLSQAGYYDVDQYYYSRLNEMAGSILSKAEQEIKVLRSLPGFDNANKKQNIDDYFKENSETLNPRDYPALAILRGLGLKVTVKRVRQGKLPKQKNIVKQLDYGS